MVGHLAAAAIHTRLGAKDGVALTPSYFVDLNAIPPSLTPPPAIFIASPEILTKPPGTLNATTRRL